MFFFGWTVDWCGRLSSNPSRIIRQVLENDPQCCALLTSFVPINAECESELRKESETCDCFSWA
jgi:hypothetical protein